MDLADVGVKTGDLWVVSELFYPEETSTGQVMTSIAKGLLSSGIPVRALCVQPSYSMSGTSSPRRESHDGVEIVRVRATSLGKNSVAARVVDMASFAVSAAYNLWRQTNKEDVFLVVTNPPILPYVVALIAKAKGAKFAVVVHDMFPEVLDVVSGPSRASSVLRGVLHKFSKWLYKSADSIVAIGPDQAERIAKKTGARSSHKTVVIPLPHDNAFIKPVPLRAHSQFLEKSIPLERQDSTIFQIAGNIGPLQGIDFLLPAIAEKRISDAHFCFVGNGALKSLVDEQSSENITTADWVPRSEAPDLHAGCDVIIVSLVAGMSGVSVPSRVGNALAAGKPILGIVGQGSAVDRLIAEHGVGWSVRPGNVDQFWDAIEDACRDTEKLARYSDRARKVGLDLYSPGRSDEAYRSLATALLGHHE